MKNKRSDLRKVRATQISQIGSGHHTKGLWDLWFHCWGGTSEVPFALCEGESGQIYTVSPQYLQFLGENNE